MHTFNNFGYKKFSSWWWFFKRWSESSYCRRFGGQFWWIWSHRFRIDLPNHWGWSRKVPVTRVLEISSKCIESWGPTPHANSIRAERHASRSLWFFWHSRPSSIRYRCSALGFLMMHQRYYQKYSSTEVWQLEPKKLNMTKSSGNNLPNYKSNKSGSA